MIAKNPAQLAAVYGLAAADTLGPYAGLLGNHGDTIRVRDASGHTVDAVTYDSKFPWPGSADALGAADRFTGLNSADYQYKGRSLQRVSVAWPSSDPANWVASPLSGPTPGGAQAVTRSTPKPVVIAQSAVQTSDGAVLVRSNQAVTVACAYSATNDVSDVALEYFVDDMNSTSETRTSVAMTDLGDGKYTAAIPGQSNRSLVRYRFKANRGDGLEVISPRADDPQIAPVGANGAREAWWGYFVTPARTTTNVAIYDVLVSTAALRTMTNNIVQSPKRVTAANATGLPRATPYVDASAPQWDGTVPGVLAYNGQVWDIHIRYHASLYHRTPSNLAYKVHFPNHQPLNNQTAWYETLHGLEFIEAQKLNRLIGLPASKMRRVDWYFNNSANLVHSEQGEYAAEMLDAYHKLQQQLNPGSTNEATGELYKDVGDREASQNSTEGPYTRGDEAPLAANAGWTQLQRYDWTFALQNNGWKGPRPLRDLIEGMWTARGDSPSSPNFANSPAQLASARAWFTNHWDLENTLTSMALLEWMSIWDDACQNHFFWRRASGKWSRLGWDYDSVMSVSGGGGGGPGGGGPGGGGGGAMGGATNQTIYGGEAGAPIVFDGTNWWMDTFFKCFRAEYNQRLWELNNSFCDPANLTALGFSIAPVFAKGRCAYVNSQLSALGAYYKPNRPVNVWPANSATVLSATNFTTSAYSHPQTTPHWATKWEVRAANGDYEEPILRLTTTNRCLTNYPIPFDQLTYGQTYYWRASHLDANGHPSDVSAETSFTWGVASASAGALALNEILANNRTTVENGGKYPDYIELKNNTDASIGLAGYALTGDPLKPTQFTFPSDAFVAAGAYLLVWADTDTAAPGLHAGIELDSAGQSVLLLHDGTIADSVTFGPQAPDVSIGRILDGAGGWQANAPTPGAANAARTLGDPANLLINEWMADPAYGDDWFELYNADTRVVALAGLYLSDAPSTPMLTAIPALSFIAGNGFTQFRADGSTAGGNHTNFKLSKSGDNIVLTAANGATAIDSITFSAQAKDVSQGRLPDGASAIVSFSSKTASPGAPNWAPASAWINELLAHPASPFEDAVEVYNPTTSAVDLGGWWLSDDVLMRQKYQIAAGTIIAAGGYIVFYGADFASGAAPFRFNARGAEAVLSAVDGAGALTGYGARVRFGASLENTSFGRIAAKGLNCSSGGAEFWALTAPTFGEDNPESLAVFRTGAGATNAAPKIGPVAINEIMYHPPDYSTNVAGANSVDDTNDEFIELCNFTAQAVDLSGWRLRGDSEFTFPPGATIAGGGYALLVSFDPANAATLAGFVANYSLTTKAVIYGPYSAKLPNSTANLELAYPILIDGYADYVTVDRVQYRDSSPWPASADGGGNSLQRASARVIGNTAANWVGAPPTPGAINAGVATSLSMSTPAYRDGVFQCLVTSPTASNYAIEASTNLFEWEEVFTTNSPTAPFWWTDPSAGASPLRFYRLRSEP